MKKIIALFIVLISLMPACVTAADNITVEINGYEVYFEDQQPVIVDGRTLVPFRAIAEALGCLVDWVDEEKCVYIAFARTEHVQILQMQIDNPSISVVDYKNSEDGVVMEQMSVSTDVPATVINSRTMVPLRVIGDIFGGDVGWNGDSKIASITVDLTDHIFATDEICREFMEGTYYKAKHILISSGETRTEEEAKAIADEVTAKIKNGGDFDKLMKEYSEDPGLEAYPDGYIFTDGEMVAEFENAVKSLNKGSMTDEPVKSSFGYHIIKREAFTDTEFDSFVAQTKFYILIALSGLDVD